MIIRSENGAFQHHGGVLVDSSFNLVVWKRCFSRNVRLREMSTGYHFPHDSTGGLEVIASPPLLLLPWTMTAPTFS
jgi:hypothetical protein